MSAGRRNRKITILQATESKNEIGEVVATWEVYRILSARVRVKHADEQQADYALFEDVEVIFDTLFYGDITRHMRVFYNNDSYEIKANIEQGQRRGSKIFTKLIRD